MDKSKLKLSALLLFSLILVVMLLTAGGSLAQHLVASSEPDGDPVEYMPPSYDSGDPSFKSADIRPPDENTTSLANRPALTFSYYQVAGATLRGRNSTTGYVYDGDGCSHVTAGSDTGRILNTELPLPDGSIIKYLRVYYRDTNAANGVEGYITRYEPGTLAVDLVHTGSTDAFVGGDGFVVSQEITETVNNTLYAYTLIGWPDAVNIANQICGLRVAYYAPTIFPVFLPNIFH